MIYIKKIKELTISEYLISINIIVFIIMFLVDSKFSTKTVVNFGSKVNYLIADGEYFRFFTPIFLHLSFYHLGFNCLAIYILGRDIESIFGKDKFLIIYFFAGFTSSLASFLFNSSISAGASGAVFGLLGSHVFLYFNFKENYKKIYGNSFLVLIAINLVFGFIHPNIDNMGHIGGLIGGILITYALHVKNYKFNLKRKIITFLIIPLLTMGITTYGIQNYNDSVEYYIYKGLTLIQMEKYSEASDTLLIGKENFPMYSDFDYLLNHMETLK
ncbi:MAG: rhomboid family intramembrane serine protease [Bacillota bacterium]|nr:rhomboid family intramembrane serine protease [Bacillota bacterium]